MRDGIPARGRRHLAFERRGIVELDGDALPGVTEAQTRGRTARGADFEIERSPDGQRHREFAARIRRRHGHRTADAHSVHVAPEPAGVVADHLDARADHHSTGRVDHASVQVVLAIDHAGSRRLLAFERAAIARDRTGRAVVRHGSVGVEPRDLRRPSPVFRRTRSDHPPDEEQRGGPRDHDPGYELGVDAEDQAASARCGCGVRVRPLRDQSGEHRAPRVAIAVVVPVEARAQHRQAAGDPRSHGVVRHVLSSRDLARSEPFQVPQRDRRLVGLLEREDGLRELPLEHDPVVELRVGPAFGAARVALVPGAQVGFLLPVRHEIPHDSPEPRAQALLWNLRGRRILESSAPGLLGQILGLVRIADEVSGELPHPGRLGEECFEVRRG